MKKLLDNFVLVFIVFIPFLYLYLSYGIREEMNLNYLGFIFISVFFVMVYIYLFVNKVKPKMLIGYLLFMLLAVGFTFINQLSSFANIRFILGILFFPIFILFFSNYENKWINQKYISYVYLIFAFILTISYLFRFNVNLTFEYRKGFIGLFYGSNVISPIIAVLMPIALNYAYKSKSFIVKGLFYVCTFISIIFIGTKTVYAALGVYIIYCLLGFFKRKPHIALMVATFASATVIVLPLIPQYQNFRTERIYNAINDDTNYYNMESFDKYLFSYKLRDTRDTFKYLSYRNNRYNFVFGNDYNRIGIDAVDILFTMGLAGLIIYVGFMIYILAKSKIKGIYRVLFIMMLFASFFQGNILTNYLVYIYIAVLFLLYKNDKQPNNRILYISNMYPSKKDKTYGIFVKNVKDTLDKDYTVDKVVIGKHYNVVMKALAYLYLHTNAFLKVVFGDYEYIYIHFVSHSSAGAILGSYFTKDEKIIFNVHGNDIVADREIDEKNVIRSKKYLKHAYKVVVPSEYFKEVVRDEYKINEKKIVVYPSGGVDIDLFKKIDKKEAKEYLKLDTKTKYIGYVSRIEKDKGYDTFIEAVNVISKDKKYKNYKYIILGSGSENYILEELIKKYKLQDKVIRLGKLTREELPYVYNALDVFVYPTRRKSESLGLVGLEAMSCETLVVSSDARGPLSYVKNKKNAYVFNKDDYNDLINVLDNVIELNDKDIDKITKVGRKTAMEYDINKIDNMLLKAFK